MELIKVVDGHVVTEEEQAYAVRRVAETINEAISNVANDETRLDKGYARLAALLARFHAMEGWIFMGFGSMAQYLKSLEAAHNRSAGQLWAYTEVGKWLSSVGEDGLNKMGISKAFEIVRATKQAKKTAVDPKLIEIALDDKSTIAIVRAAAHHAYALPAGELPAGTYYDFGGFYMDETEREELKDFWAIVRTLFGYNDQTPQWKVVKSGIMAAVREFNGTHAADAHQLEEGR
jgi:hypothetical protein